MSARTQTSEMHVAAQQLARALRAGLELRRTSPTPPRTVANLFLQGDNVRSFLGPYADSYSFALPRRRNPLHHVLHLARQLVRKLIAPWLHLQSHFNLSTINVVEQVEQRVRDLEEAEASLRQTVQTLEKTLLPRVDPEVSGAERTLEGGYWRRVNLELGWKGKIAEGGLWFNPPIIVQVDRDGPRVAGVSERILEHVFVHTRLPRPPARLLDLGCSESSNALEMASLGFDVVGVDLRTLPLSHPNFTMVQANLADLPFEDESFDVAVALSTLEHIGLGWYTEAERGSSDEQAVAEIFRVLKHGGRFLVTVPFGLRAATPLHRIYDRAGLDRLLHSFRVVERGFGLRDGDAWSFSRDDRRADQTDSSARVSAVCLMVLEKP